MVYKAVRAHIPPNMSFSFPEFVSDKELTLPEINEKTKAIVFEQEKLDSTPVAFFRNGEEIWTYKNGYSALKA